MRLFKRPSKPKKGQRVYWYARIRIDGKDRWISSRLEVGKCLKREAEERILEIVKERQAGITKPKSNVIKLRAAKAPAGQKLILPGFSKHAPITEVVQEFVRYRRLNNMNSWKANLYFLNRFAEYVGSETSIRAIGFEAINDFKASLKETHKATAINTYLSVLHKFFEDVKHVWKLIDEREPNPVTLAGWITIKDENQEERIVFTDEEIAALRAAAKPYFLPWINLALKTGAREVELWKLHESHVRRADQNVWIPPSKTLKGRYVGLGPDGMKQVEELIKVSPDGYLLRNRGGKRFKDAGRVSPIFKRTREKAGLERGTFHCLRHTAATRLIRAGKSLEEVQYILGHKNILTTRIYIHALEEAPKASLALDKI